MNSATFVDNLVAKLTTEGVSKSSIVTQVAEASMGWPYVWGGYGQLCTPSQREAYANRSVCPSSEAEIIRKKCQVLNGSKGSCTGCNWFPGGSKTRFFDCRGFTMWTLLQAGIKITGAGATSQYNTNANWSEKGEIANMPDVVCCVFKYSSKTGKMEHTGLHVGGGRIIHCSGTVKEAKTTDKGWTNYAIPKGIDDIPTPATKPTLRRGDKGAYVTMAQTELQQRGYDVGASGIDGAFGKGTEAAVKAFQKDHTDENGKPLSVDGVIGQKTWWALDNATPTILYTVNIPHLTLAQAESICLQYPGSTKTEERGVNNANW